MTCGPSGGIEGSAQHVAGGELLDDAAELGAIGLRGARDFAERAADTPSAVKAATWASTLCPCVDITPNALLEMRKNYTL
jgi:hypothetical protein